MGGGSAGTCTRAQIKAGGRGQHAGGRIRGAGAIERDVWGRGLRVASSTARQVTDEYEDTASNSRLITPWCHGHAASSRLGLAIAIAWCHVNKCTLSHPLPFIVVFFCVGCVGNCNKFLCTLYVHRDGRPVILYFSTCAGKRRRLQLH